jgi:hypothetical protein
VSFLAAVVLALYGAFLLFIRRQEAGRRASLPRALLTVRSLVYDKARQTT